MELEEDIKNKLDDCIYNIYVTSGSNYTRYTLKIVDELSTEIGGEYIPNEQILYVYKDLSECYELVFLTVLHELSHHINFVQKSNLTHDKSFREIQKKLLYASFNLGYVNPSKLLVAEQYLSNHSEKNIIIKLCEKYIMDNNIPLEWCLKVTYFKEKRDQNYIYSPILKGYYKFIKNKDSDKLIIFKK